MTAQARQLLTERLAQLTRRHEALDAHLTNADRELPADWDDRAQTMENDEVMEGIDAITLAEIGNIRRALERMDNGSYGTCARCGDDIGEGRLHALPTAATCVDCAD